MTENLLVLTASYVGITLTEFSEQFVSALANTFEVDLSLVTVVSAVANEEGHLNSILNVEWNIDLQNFPKEERSEIVSIAESRCLAYNLQSNTETFTGLTITNIYGFSRLGKSLGIISKLDQIKIVNLRPQSPT